MTALQPTIHTLNLSQAFAGLVVVAIAGNAVENVVGIQLAFKNQADYALSVIINSPIQIALVLAILSAPSAISTAYNAFNNGIGFVVGDIPAQAYWRALITPAVRTIYWLSQILFLWTAWGKPENQSSH